MKMDEKYYTARVVRQGYRKARKDHICEGYLQIEESAPELLPLAHDGVNKGEEYFYQVNSKYGIRDFKCCMSCWEIIQRYDLFSTDIISEDKQHVNYMKMDVDK